jgi:hypothetical protein
VPDQLCESPGASPERTVIESALHHQVKRKSCQ